MCSFQLYHSNCPIESYWEAFVLNVGLALFLPLLTHSVVSSSLWPPQLQHARPPCLSPSPGICSNLCPLSQWCHPTISSSVVPVSSCLQSFPASGSSPMSQFLASGGQSTGASASSSVLPMNIQDWFPLEMTGLISLLSKGLSRVFSSTTVQKHQSAISIHTSTLFWHSPPPPPPTIPTLGHHSLLCYHRFPLALYFIQGSVYMSLLLYQPQSSFLKEVLRSI